MTDIKETGWRMHSDGDREVQAQHGSPIPAVSAARQGVSGRAGGAFDIPDGLGGVGTEYPTMQKLVTDRLRAAILAGRFGPGERLSHDDLARWLGVSRMPVREALRVLHAEGLVALRPHRGAVVVDLHPEDIEEIFEIRIMLEAPAARRAALRLTDTHVERIRQFYSDSIAPRVGEETWLDLNRDFHGVIYEACAWPRLINLLDSLRNAVAPYLRAALTLAGRMDTANLEHLQILKACEGRDGDLLAKLTSEHLNSTKAGLVECLSACTLEARSGSGPGPGESRNAREPM